MPILQGCLLQRIFSHDNERRLFLVCSWSYQKFVCPRYFLLNFVDVWTYINAHRVMISLAILTCSHAVFPVRNSCLPGCLWSLNQLQTKQFTHSKQALVVWISGEYCDIFCNELGKMPSGFRKHWFWGCICKLTCSYGEFYCACSLMTNNKISWLSNSSTVYVLFTLQFKGVPSKWRI